VISSFIFPVHNIDLQQETIAPLERARHYGLEIKLTFCFVFYLHVISAFEEHGNIYKPVCMLQIPANLNATY
jgi:hypothetical protein